MKILVTGATGLVGGKLVETLAAEGHGVLQLSRSNPENENEVQWDAYQGFAADEASKLENLDAVIHLAGESIAESWTAEKKRRIRDSRVIGTRTLVNALQSLTAPPKILVAASAIGFYGDREDEILTEDAARGEGFLPDVSDEWEKESRRAEEFGARVVLLRIGVVIAREGGALEKMLTPFKFGVGGTVGSGKQWMSWIALDDLVKIIHFALDTGDIGGPVNATAPNPVQNKEFTDTLGAVLHRPTILPVPAFGVKLLFGEMGETLLLQGARVLPQKLLESGFQFDYPELDAALRHVLAE